MTVFHELADELDVNERTLRRAVERGLIRATRVSERRVDMPFAERRYVQTHWPLLAGLLSSVRTRHNVRLAVVFGSTARGDDHPLSDVDLVVAFGVEEFHSAATLAETLGEEIGRPVQAVSLETARATPLLLASVLLDGRVLVDRDGEWPKLKRTESQIVRDARRAELRLDQQMAELSRLVGPEI